MTTISSDIRADSVDRKRARNRAEKYYGFRAVKVGELSSVKINHQIKQKLYQEAQRWPRPPTYHHAHVDKLDKRGAKAVYENRRYRKRELRKYGQALKNPDDSWRQEEEGKRCLQGCWYCDAMEEYRAKKEAAYEWSAACLEVQLQDQLCWKGESLVDMAVARREEQMVEDEDAEGEEWYVVGSTMDWSDSNSDFELVDASTCQDGDVDMP